MCTHRIIRFPCFREPQAPWARSRARLYLTDDKSCIPDVQYYLCVELYRNAWEKDGVEGGAGREGGLHWGLEGGGTSAQLLN